MPETEPSINQLAAFERAGSLTAPECAAFSAATLYAKRLDHDQPPETAYLCVLPDARQRILLRLIGGLLRDHPESISEPTFITSGEQSSYEPMYDALPPIELESLLTDFGVPEKSCQLASFRSLHQKRFLHPNQTNIRVCTLLAHHASRGRLLFDHHCCPAALTDYSLLGAGRGRRFPG